MGRPTDFPPWAAAEAAVEIKAGVAPLASWRLPQKVALNMIEPSPLATRECTRDQFRRGQSSYQRMAIVGILTVQAAMLAYSATRHSPTHLEPAFIAAGVSHWHLGRFEQYRVNPPLPRLVATLPLIALGVATDWKSYDAREGIRSEFQIGQDFLLANKALGLWPVIYARWAGIPFFLIGGLTAYLWARDLYGDQAAFLTLLLWTFEPNLLGHAELVTPDSACVTLNLLACYLFWRWLEFPSSRSCFLAGLSLGLAESAKMTSLLLYPVFAILLSVKVTMAATRTPGRNEAASQLPSGERQIGMWVTQFMMIVAISLYVINACYCFDGTLTRLKDYSFVSRALGDVDNLHCTNCTGNRFASGMLGEHSIPLPKQYVLGFDLQQKDFESFMPPSYLRGEWRMGGWWYYYIYGLCVRLPVSILLLLTCTACARAYRIRSHPMSLGEAALVIPPVVLLLIASLQTSFNIHFRYVLPCISAILVFVGQSTSIFHNKRRYTFVLLALLLVYSMAGTLRAFPHCLAYFNDFVGLNNGSSHLLGSSVDWGQDLILVRDYVEANREKAKGHDITLISRSPAIPGLLENSNIKQVDTHVCISKLPPGIFIVSRNIIHGEQYRLPFSNIKRREPGMEDSCSLFESLPAIDTIGLTHVVYLMKEEL